MPPLFSLGNTDFADIRRKRRFYVDKTQFITQWWQSGDRLTWITRPRRFGKTLMLRTVEEFFSPKYSDQATLFRDLAVWQSDNMRRLAGTIPVISVSFAHIVGTHFSAARGLLVQTIKQTFSELSFLQTCPHVSSEDQYVIKSFSSNSVSETDLQHSLFRLCRALFQHSGHRVLLLIDEFDTPMHDALTYGYSDELVTLLNSMLNLTLQDNPYLDRGLFFGIAPTTGLTGLPSLRSLELITTVSDDYSTAFGFTESEVFAALDRCGLSDHRNIKDWYDGFTFGHSHNIYNPWSIINYLQKKKFEPYWVNTSSNALAGQLIQESNAKVKQDFERLLQGETVVTPLTESIIFQDLKSDASALWSLLLASGYLKIAAPADNQNYRLALTNREVRVMFEKLVRRWFDDDSDSYADFVDALLSDDVWAMNETLNNLTRSVFSFFDTNTEQPEKFYHGFVLGLLVTLKDRFIITSNRESGFGRYDVVLEPRDKTKDDAYILEFKVHRTGTLEDSLKVAHEQIRTKGYAADLLHRGVPEDRIRAYGLVFDGKKVLIG